MRTTADGSGDEQLLTLQEAAESLKVHYMTAYRWVRRGELPAFKAGGRLRVRAGDLQRFVSARQVDVALPAHVPGRTEWDVHVRRLLRHLLAGEATEANSLIRKVVADGAPAGDVYLNLLTPVLHLVGNAWAAGEIGVAEEHRATEVCAGIIARLGDHFRRRGPARGAAVTVTVPEELHSLGAAMVADFLRGWGYRVHHLGASVPLADLALFLQSQAVDAVCVSVTTRDAGAEVYAAVVAAADRAGARTVVVGGQAADPVQVRSAGAVHEPDLRLLPRRLEVTGG